MAKKDKTDYLVYIDGASRGNPGHAGIGIVIKKNTGDKEISRLYNYIGQTTNNVAEYTALVYGLQEALIKGLKNITVYSDSELIVRHIKGEYKVKSADLKPYYEQSCHLLRGFDDFEIRHLPREENREADKLANKAIQERQKSRE